MKWNKIIVLILVITASFVAVAVAAPVAAFQQGNSLQHRCLICVTSCPSGFIRDRNGYCRPVHDD